MENNKNIKKDFLNLPKDNPFEVPENYFNEFPNRLQENINTHKQSNNNKTIFLKLSPFFKMVASLLILAAITFVIIKSANSDNTIKNSYTDITENTDIEIINDIDENTIIDVLVEKTNILNEEDIDDDEIIEYLAYNTNYSTIIDEY